MIETKEWFENWFDSPYYHILYQNHNEQTAKDFIDNLFQKLTPQYSELKPTSFYKILDLACGKGRHSRYMAAKGFDVTGIDLSENSIRFARQFEADNLSFFQHDMRKPFRINYFDYVFNIFTSFGYFDKDADNVTALKCVHDGLKENGIFILDYFNSNWVRQTLVPKYQVTAADIVFNISKHIENGHIYKTIVFEAQEGNVQKKYRFQEKVRLFSMAEFENIFEKAGLKIVEKYGDYQLNPFDKQTSNRLIIKAIKNSKILKFQDFKFWNFGMPPQYKSLKINKMQRFHTTLQSINGATSPIVIAVVPFDIEAVFGIKNRVDIRGTIDGYAFERTLLPLGDGRYYFMLNAKILKAIRKKMGDEVFIEIDENENTGYKEVELPDYFLMELEENPIAKTQYALSNPSMKRWVAQYLEAKSADVRANRVLKVLETLERQSQQRIEKEKMKKVPPQ